VAFFLADLTGSSAGFQESKTTLSLFNTFSETASDTAALSIAFEEDF
jgi:hypothetical protein